jgi:DNA-binding transcriptional regulator YiaG
MKKKYQSKILQAIHEDMKDMHTEGLISDERMRYFDTECLVEEPKTTHKATSSAGTERGVRISAKGAGS